MEQKKPADKPQQRHRGSAGNRFPLVVQTLQGLEDVLAAELSRIGGNDIKPAKRAVYCTADMDLVYKANIRLRTALRVLVPLRNFQARDEDALYAGAKAIDWISWFGPDKTFAVKATTTGPVHTHSQYAALKVKDAIADHFREKLGVRPDVDKQKADIIVHLRIYNEEVNISLDSSGEPLNRRGYRHQLAEAPLNESLAAGMLLLAGYDGRTAFVDGMCGSGTLPIEAALIARNIAPGLLRDNFAFMHWKNYDEALFRLIHNATVERIRDCDKPVVGIEKDFATVNMARESAVKAGVDDLIDFRFGDFLHETPPPAPGLLVMNPPYDERLRLRDAAKFYSDIGARFKNAYAGYACWVLSGHLEAMHEIGLRSFQTYHLVNGMLQCRYSGYRMYTGSARNR